MYTGRTPYPGPRKGAKDSARVAPLLDYYREMEASLKQRLREMGRYPAKDLSAFFAKHEEKRATYGSGKRRFRGFRGLGLIQRAARHDPRGHERC